MALSISENENHVMRFTRIRVLEAFFALIRKGVQRVIERNQETFGNFSKQTGVYSKFMINWTLFALNWAFAGDLKLKDRALYFEKLTSSIGDFPEGLHLPPIDSSISLIDYEVKLEDGEFHLWRD